MKADSSSKPRKRSHPDIINARFFVTGYALLAGTGFVLLGTFFHDQVLAQGGMWIITSIVSFYLGRRTFRPDEAAEEGTHVVGAVATATTSNLPSVEAQSANLTGKPVDAVKRTVGKTIKL